MKAIKFTEEEAGIILHCIRIAREDGSIYGDRQPGENGEFEKRQEEIDRIQAKLMAAWT